MTAMFPASTRVAHSDMTLAEWTKGMKRSVLREMLAVVSKPGIISFAGGLPAPELFPAAEFAEVAARVLRTDPKALQYGPPFQPLKEHIVDLMEKRGVICTADQVFVTTGAQQALNILVRLFLNPGGQVIIEELVYSGIQQAIASRRPEILAVPTNLKDGIDIDYVEAHLVRGARPAFLYAISEAHNPLGVSISNSNQRRLVELARAYGLPIVEDDPYGLLRYEASNAFPMRALDEHWVFYVGSFSKIIAPALRLGWIIVPKYLLPKLTVIKEAYDLETSALIQRTVSGYLDTGHLPIHLERLRTEYGQRRDAMMEAMTAYFPSNVTWTRPSGGMFIWVTLPDHVNTTDLLKTAVDEAHVAYIPGSAFSAYAGSTVPEKVHLAENCMRLNFSNCAPEVIQEGITQLGEILHRYC